MGAWLLAAAMALAHGLLAVFLIVGAPPAARRPRLMRWYLAMLVPTAVVNLGRFPCPLTVWEKDLWRLAGETPYRGGFISHYFVKPFHSGGLSPTGEDLLLISVVVWCLSWLLYSSIWHLRRRLRGNPAARSTAAEPPGSDADLAGCS